MNSEQVSRSNIGTLRRYLLSQDTKAEYFKASSRNIRLLERDDEEGYYFFQTDLRLETVIPYSLKVDVFLGPDGSPVMERRRRSDLGSEFCQLRFFVRDVTTRITVSHWRDDGVWRTNASIGFETKGGYPYFGIDYDDTDNNDAEAIAMGYSLGDNVYILHNGNGLYTLDNKEYYDDGSLKLVDGKGREYMVNEEGERIDISFIQDEGKEHKKKHHNLVLRSHFDAGQWMDVLRSDDRQWANILRRLPISYHQRDLEDDI